jgi:hypothetical protein
MTSDPLDSDAQAEADEEHAETPSQPDGDRSVAAQPAADPGRTTGDCDIGRQSDGVDGDAKERDLQSRVRRTAIDELWQQGEKEQRDLRVQDIAQEGLPEDGSAASPCDPERDTGRACTSCRGRARG